MPSRPVTSSDSLNESKPLWNVATRPDGKRSTPVKRRSTPLAIGHLLAVDLHRLLAGDEPRAGDAVAAHVHERAALEIGVDPDIGVVPESVAEGRAHVDQLADAGPPAH